MRTSEDAACATGLLEFGVVERVNSVLLDELVVLLDGAQSLLELVPQHPQRSEHLNIQQLAHGLELLLVEVVQRELGVEQLGEADDVPVVNLLS